jgi:hypothetical protein
MINYTERLSALMQDVIARVEPLAFIRMPEIIVFARQGRADAAGAFATCHSLNMPTSDPGYYFWRDRASGRLTRRSEWFVTTTPEVYVGSTRIKYLISFALPRFCEQSLTGSRKAAHYDGADRWIAKLDTVVHELYHIDPRDTGIRQMERTDGTYSPATHGPLFYSDVARMVKLYLASSPRPEMYDFLRFDFAGLEKKYGVRQRRGNDVPQLSVLSTAVRAAARRSARRSWCAGREAEAVDAAAALHRRRPPRAPLLAGLLADPPRSDEAGSPVASAHPLHPHFPARAGRMDELVPPDGNSDVGRTGRDRREEHEVARRDAAGLDPLAQPVDLAHRARQRHAVLTEDILHEAAAVEAARVRSPVPIRDTSKRERGGAERVAVGDASPWRRTWCSHPSASAGPWERARRCARARTRAGRGEGEQRHRQPAPSDLNVRPRGGHVASIGHAPRPQKARALSRCRLARYA